MMAHIIVLITLSFHLFHLNNVAGRTSRNRNKLHQILEQTHESDDFLHSSHETYPGDLNGPPQSLEYGAPCSKYNPKACKHFPEVGCVQVEEKINVCRCDFQHTWNETIRFCIPNVYAPCTSDNDTIGCGLNMECRPDLLASNPNDKFCRCKKGYRVERDEEGLPALCVVDKNFIEDDDQEEVFVSSHGICTTPGLTEAVMLAMLTCYLALIMVSS